MTDPQGNQTVLSFAYDTDITNPTGNFYETQRFVYQGSSSSGTLLLTKLNCYNNNFTNCSTATVTSPISKIDTYTNPPGLSPAVAETSYDSYGLPFDHKDFDYGTVLVRHTLRKL